MKTKLKISIYWEVVSYLTSKDSPLPACAWLIYSMFCLFTILQWLFVWCCKNKNETKSYLLGYCALFNIYSVCYSTVEDGQHAAVLVIYHHIIMGYYMVYYGLLHELIHSDITITWRFWLWQNDHLKIAYSARVHQLTI